jgi:cytochrome P450
MGTGMRVMLGRWQGLAPKTKFQEACRQAHEYLEHYIQQSKNENEHSNEHSSTLDDKKHRSMIQGLTEQTDNIEFIRSQILQGMMASQETTAVLISNTMFLLAKHPKEWAKLRAEISGKGKALLDFDSLSTSKIIQNILSECGFFLLS